MQVTRRISTRFLLTSVYLVIPVFLLMTNPEKLPLPLLILPFVLLFAALFLTARLLLRRYFANLGGRYNRGLALALATLPVLLLILQSIGQLSIRDLLITAGLLIGLVFYFRKTDFLK
jgi:hypothetical protein